MPKTSTLLIKVWEAKQASWRVSEVAKVVLVCGGGKDKTNQSTNQSINQIALQVAVNFNVLPVKLPVKLPVIYR